ncbi:MAG: glycosyltransferase family 4 protein [Chloroflexi bacterium]|nr:glycosyltransferase family 4 protein [Chloroflexota bacterium]
MKPKNIGIFHYQVGHTDGVSLEIEKWQRIFEEMGHHVHLCAGDLGSADGTLIPEMYHHRPEVERLAYNTFKELHDFDEAGYQAELDRQSGILAEHFRAFVVEREIDLIVAQNVWCVGTNPGVAVALEKVRREFDLPALAHHHDFYWERGDDRTLTCAAAAELAENYLPPRDPKIRHVVINSLAQANLAERKGVAATIIPNVFDFDAPAWEKDEYNKDFREAIGLTDSDLLILQATRVVARKGIELAIDLTKAIAARRRSLEATGLHDGRPFTAENRIVLVLAGYTRDDVAGEYVSKLKEKAEAEGVELLFIEEWIANEREVIAGRKIYTLWDSYVFADLVTYPSLWEGWGNQFLEAVRAELPIVIFEYPVYRADIGDKGFAVISLGFQIQRRDTAGLVQVPAEVIERAADQAVEILTNCKLHQKTVHKNLELGRRYYSMDVLRKLLEEELSVWEAV